MGHTAQLAAPATPVAARAAEGRGAVLAGMLLAGMLLAAACAVLALSAPAFGHGVGFERLDPVQLGDREVTLEVSTPPYDPDNPEKEITFSLLDTETNVTIRDVTFEVAGYKGGDELFEVESRAADGTFILVARPGDTDEVVLEESKRGGFLEAIVGLQEDVIHASGRPFDTGGLYQFDVRITTAESFSKRLDPPIEYDVGISIPQKTYHEIDDPYFGQVEVSLITYYDEVSGFEYRPDIYGVSFYMPFDWSVSNINETETVHEELTFPKTFGDLLFTEYAASVNGLPVRERAVVVDGFYYDQTILHLVLNRNDLLDLRERQGGGADGMEITLRAGDGSPRGTTTANGQFKIVLDWDGELRSGQETAFRFHITDVFLDSPVATDYDLSLARGGAVFHSGSGTSADSAEGYDEITVLVPADAQGPVTFHFENLAGNPVARASIPVAVDRELPAPAVPDWVKSSAEWWAQGVIDDRTFIDSIEYLIERGVIQVRDAPAAASGDGTIPDWVKSSAEWWAQGVIDDRTFLDSIRFLIEQGVVSVRL